jgi:glutaminase
MSTATTGVPSDSVNLKDTIAELYDRHRDTREGAVATYIPELGKAHPDWFGVSVATVDGQVFEVGDCGREFTIQSVSKPLVFGLALDARGRAAVLDRVGVEPSGDAFNSILLHEQSSRPFNAMVNAGAIAVAGLVPGATAAEREGRLLQTLSDLAGRDLSVDEAVYRSERSTGHRNRSIAHLLRNYGLLDEDVEGALDLYFRQCSVRVTCRDLAVMGASLANMGVNPLTGKQALGMEHVRDVLSVMFTCGMYDFSGEWAFRVGVPAKSGVGGGILAVVNRQLGIGIFSPPLDERGNSVRGVRVCADLSEELGLHVFDVWNFGSSFLRVMLDGASGRPGQPR